MHRERGNAATDLSDICCYFGNRALRRGRVRMSNKHWITTDDGSHELLFAPWHDEELWAVLYEDDGWCYDSAKTKASGEYLGSDTLESAKAEVELEIASHLLGEMEYYATLLRLWEQP